MQTIKSIHSLKWVIILFDLKALTTKEKKQLEARADKIRKQVQFKMIIYSKWRGNWREYKFHSWTTIILVCAPTHNNNKKRWQVVRIVWWWIDLDMRAPATVTQPPSVLLIFVYTSKLTAYCAQSDHHKIVILTSKENSIFSVKKIVF